MTIKPIHEKQLPGNVLSKKCSQKIHKTDEKNLCGTRTQMFSCQFCKIFKSNFLYWTPPVAVSSSFKATGFTVVVMQTNFWIIQNLVDLNTYSSSRHFWFLRLFLVSTSFPLYLGGFFNISYNILFLTTTDRSKLIPGLSNFLLCKPLS